jgi:hypothetical protein
MGDDFDTVLENATNGSNIPEPGSVALVLIGVTAWTASRRPRR